MVIEKKIYKTPIYSYIFSFKTDKIHVTCTAFTHVHIYTAFLYLMYLKLLYCAFNILKSDIKVQTII